MSDSNLKRKRDKNGGKKSSKKVVVDGANGASTMKFSLVEDRDDWAPLVGTFIHTSKTESCTLPFAMVSDIDSIDTWSRLQQTTIPQTIHQASHKCAKKSRPQRRNRHK